MERDACKMSSVSIKLIDVTKGELLVSSLIQGYFNQVFIKLDLTYSFTPLMDMISFAIEIRDRFTMTVVKSNYYV